LCIRTVKISGKTDTYRRALQRRRHARYAGAADGPRAEFKDFSGVASIGFSTTAVLVAPSHGVKSAKELVALGNAQP